MPEEGFNILSAGENVLTWIGIISLIISIIKVVIFIFDQNSYSNVKIRFFENQDEFEKVENEYPIIDELQYGDNSSIFLIGAIDYPITKIKIFDLQVKDKNLTTHISIFDTIISRNFLLKEKLEKKLPRDILPGEYLMIRCNAPEGIPPRKIRFRVNGKIIEYDFHYNGIYGNRDMDYIKEKHDLWTLIYHWFRI